MIWYQLLIGLLISTFIGVFALRRGSLTRSGAAGAILTGTLTMGFGGLVWAVLLVAFFVSSSRLSHFKEDEKKAAAEKFDKGNQRDFGQTMANGGLGTIAAVLSYFMPEQPWLAFYVGVMATVTADTWATELGTLSKTPPRLITSGRTVEVGTSGGITWLGTAVSTAGGLFIGLLAGLLSSPMAFSLILAGTLAGLAGSLFDSLLGATVQQIYYCDVCQKETEKKVHCGQPTRPFRGWSWLNNDIVNAIASLVGGLVAVLIGQI